MTDRPHDVEWTPGPRAVFLLAIGIGLITGLVSGPLVAVKRAFLQPITFQGPHLYWTAPVAYTLFFGVVGLILAGVVRLRAGTLTHRVAFFVVVFLAAWSSLMVFRRQLHQGAVVLLAAGVAAQATHVIARHAAGIDRFARRSLPWLAALVPLIAALVYLQPAISERRALAALPRAPEGAPNVLLLVLDAVRAANLSAYGYQRPTTPTLKRLAAGGARFDRAIVTAPWTFPSHASMFTGRFPHEFNADWGTTLPRVHRTLAQELGARGWASAGFVGNIFHATRESGLARGFAHYEDRSRPTVEELLVGAIPAKLAMRALIRAVGLPPIRQQRSGAQINAAALRWLDRRDADRPFFMFVNYFDAHAPYRARAPFDTLFRPAPAGRAEQLLAAYDRAIAYVDWEIQYLFAELERRHLLENTLVIVTSDHGDEFGEHVIFGHGHSLYFPSLHVPLIVSFPGRVPVAAVAEPVSLRDLPATVLDVLDLDGSPFPGGSLAAFWSGSSAAEPVPRTVLSEASSAPDAPRAAPTRRGDLQSLVAGNLHYIRFGDGVEELYDHVRDPFERHDLAPLQAATLDRFRTILDRLLGAAYGS